MCVECHFEKLYEDFDFTKGHTPELISLLKEKITSNPFMIFCSREERSRELLKEIISDREFLFSIFNIFKDLNRNHPMSIMVLCKNPSLDEIYLKQILFSLFLSKIDPTPAQFLDTENNKHMLKTIIAEDFNQLSHIIKLISKSRLSR